MSFKKHQNDFRVKIDMLDIDKNSKTSIYSFARLSSNNWRFNKMAANHHSRHTLKLGLRNTASSKRKRLYRNSENLLKIPQHNTRGTDASADLPRSSVRVR